MFDYELLLASLSDLGAEKVEDKYNGDRIDVPTGHLRAITVSPGDGGEKTYLVDVTVWDEAGDSHDIFVGETDDPGHAADLVRGAYVEEEKRLELEDATWADTEAGR